MPALVLVPASPSDLEPLARVQFEAWSKDPGFNAIFPKGATADALQHTVVQLESDMEDLTRHLMLIKDAMTGTIAAYAVWQFFPQRSHDEVEREMLTDHFPLPRDANLEAGNRLIHNAVRKHHEVVAKHFGHGAAHAYLFAIATNPRYARQGAASILMKWGVERADDLNLPCYLESTPVAKDLYLKHGFEVVDELRLQIPSVQNYHHCCMIRQASS